MAEANISTLERIMHPRDGTKPETNTHFVRLYNHNLCPFSARARYYLAAKGIQFQECMIDLNEKAQWHSDFNGGMSPVLETPKGDLILDSAIVAQYALESNPTGGIQLIPSDPVEAAKMRMKMEAFNKTLSNMFPMILSRGQDVEKIMAYKNNALPIYEKMCTEANGKFLLGTDDITALDIHVASILELAYLFQGGVYADVDEHVKVNENAPNFCAYMDKFRNHPVMKGYRQNRAANQKHAARSRAWDPELKCQLSLDVLEGCWPDQEN